LNSSGGKKMTNQLSGQELPEVAANPAEQAKKSEDPLPWLIRSLVQKRQGEMDRAELKEQTGNPTPSE
jgi:hypothetical protein